MSHVGCGGAFQADSPWFRWNKRAEAHPGSTFDLTVSQEVLLSLAASQEGPGDKAIFSLVTDHYILSCSSLQDLLLAHEEEDTDKFADIVRNSLHT